MSTEDPSGYPARPVPAGGPADPAEPSGLLTEFETQPEIVPPESRWHIGADIGLLVLRLVLGCIMIAHGLQKLGMFGGPGITRFAASLEENFGFTSHTTVLAWITAAAEVGGGVMLVAGLFTPLAAAGILGLTASIIALKASAGFFAPEGFEFELMLAGAAGAVLFTGSGRIALDANTPWRRNPLPFATVGLVLAVGAAVAVLVVFR